MLQILLLIPCVFVNSRDPEVGMTTMQVIAYYGYPVEEHKATTADGYILTLHRIPRGKNRQDGNRPAVLLQHALLSTDFEFVSNGREKSIAFILSDAGHDVWLGNSRGNLYSNEHTTLSPKQEQYWQFSWDEMATYDVPANVNYVLQVTNRSELYYIGFSQGTMLLFANAVQRTSVAAKIKHNFAIAPVISVMHLRGRFMNRIRAFSKKIEMFLGPNVKQALGNPMMLRPFCGSLPLNRLCLSGISDILGTSNQMNLSRIPVFTSNMPGGTSMQNIQHWTQMKSGTRHFDHGEKENLRRYGTKIPPGYDFSSYSIPTTLFFSDADNLANSDDVKILLATLPKKSIAAAYNLTGFNHYDFLVGERAKSEVFQKIIESIEALENV